MMKNDMCLVTIGIPVYNAEVYIERCLISVLNQTFDSYEVLLVDDCGKDNSIQKALDVASSHPKGDRVRIVHHNKNKGVAEARNTIINEASGKYLFFMDSDDRISSDAIRVLYDKAEKTNAETVWGSFVNIENDTERILPAINGLGQYPDLCLIGDDCLAMYGCQDIKEHLQQSIWNILYRLDFLKKNNLHFKQHGSFDDGIFQAEMQPLVNRAVLMPNVTYYYYHRPDSLTHVVSRNGYSIREAINAINAIKCHRDACNSIINKSYYDCRCAKVMKEAFYIAIGIIKHRKEMDGTISDSQLKGVMKHPAVFSQIIHFKKYKYLNLLIYFFNFLPAYLFVKVISVIAKYKHLI